MEVDGVEVFLRRTAGEGTPILMVHGNPGSSDDWLPFIERMGGPVIAPDLPGFGRSGRPARGLTMHELASFYERLLAELGVERHKLAAHDWGAMALIAEQRRPELLERLVVINAVPLLEGYRWHWVARIWRRRGLGELANATASRYGTALVLRQARGDRKPMPAEFVDGIHEHLDAGTKRAILALYRSAPEPALAAAGANLGVIECPALVVWGGSDPYLPAWLGAAYAERLANAELLELPELGHWPWMEDPNVIERVTSFLE